MCRDACLRTRASLRDARYATDARTTRCNLQHGAHALTRHLGSIPLILLGLQLLRQCDASCVTGQSFGYATQPMEVVTERPADTWSHPPPRKQPTRQQGEHRYVLEYSYVHDTRTFTIKTQPHILLLRCSCWCWCKGSQQASAPSRNATQQCTHSAGGERAAVSFSCNDKASAMLASSVVPSTTATTAAAVSASLASAEM